MLYIQSRKRKFNRVLHSKRLFQHFLINAFACVKFNNFNFVRFNQQLLRIELYRNLMNRLNQNYKFNDIDQNMTILSSNHTKFFWYMKIKKQNVFALIRKFNKYIFFIIFICNSHWEKFKRNLFHVVDIVNRFDLMIKVFQLKFKKLLRDFIERHVMKMMNAHIYVIEFSKKICYTFIFFSLSIFEMNSIKITLTTSFMQSYFLRKYLRSTRNAKLFTNWLLIK